MSSVAGGERESESESDGEGEGKSESDGEYESERESESEGESDGEGALAQVVRRVVAESESESENESEHEGESEGEGEDKSEDDGEFKATLVVRHPCCALVYNADVQCSNYASDKYTCHASGYTFCRSHMRCIQPTSITAYRAAEQARARERARLLEDGVSASMVRRIFELAGEIPFPEGDEAEDWSSHYVHRICGPTGPPRL